MNIDELQKKFNTLSVAIIGDAMLDVYLTGQSERICREAPVPVVSITHKKEVPGGAANTALNVAALGANAYFLTVIGDDIEGSILTDKLHEAGVDIRYILTDSKRQTLAKNRIIAGNQMMVRYDLDPQNTVSQKVEQELLQKLESLYPQVDAILISDYEYGIITPNVIKELQHLQERYNKILAVDSKNLEKFKDIGATLVKPNYGETIELLGIAKEENGKRARQIATNRMSLFEKTGARIVAVTLDTDGAIIFENNHTYKTTTDPQDHTKAAGAGDTYISAFCLALSAQLSTKDSAELAANAAACVAQKDGTIPCSLQDLNQYLTGTIKQVNSRSDLRELVASYHAQNKRIVFTNGCFDIIHPGHVTYLAEARKLGDVLIVGVNSDSSVKRLKGPSRPINSEDDRITVLASLASTSHVIQFDEDTPIELIKIIKPNIFVKGGDYTRETLPETPVVEHFGGAVRIIPFVMDRSTTNIIKKIRTSENAEMKVTAKNKN